MAEGERKNFNVFAYGSLMDRKCRERVIGRPGETMPATLDGYKRINNPDFKYPFAIKEPNSILHGELLINLTLEELKRIREWEKELPKGVPKHREIKVSVETEEGKKVAFVYVGDKKEIHRTT